MKKLLLWATLLACGTPLSAPAQDWGDLLKKVATEAADKITGGKLTEAAIVGTWNYTAPAVKFEGGDLLSGLGGTAMESTVTSRLEKAYALVGIKAGAASFTFSDDKSFTAELGKAKNLKGTYAFDPATHEIRLSFDKASKFKLGTVTGHAYIRGSELQLLFPVTKLVEVVTELGSKVSSLQTVAKLLEKYEEVYLGFAFGK